MTITLQPWHIFFAPIVLGILWAIFWPSDNRFHSSMEFGFRLGVVFVMTGLSAMAGAFYWLGKML